MTRSMLQSFSTRSWSVYLLYVLAVGGVATVCAEASARMTNKFTAANARKAAQSPRQLSRVERHLLERAREAVRLPPPPPEEVVALVRPAMHPADMASALDRIEAVDAAADPSQTSSRHLELAACDSAVCGKPQVRGWRKTNTAMQPAAGPRQAKLKADGANRKMLVAGKTAPLKGQSAKLPAVKLASAKPLPAKMSLLPKLVAADAEDTSPSDTLRLSRTPGDIIRISLLGSG